jgi:hypothetical protein
VQHKYQAVEIELNKRFSHGWQLLAQLADREGRGQLRGSLPE